MTPGASTRSRSSKTQVSRSVSARTRTISCLVLATGASLLGDAALYAVLPSAYATAGISLATVGLALSANRIVRLISNALVGVASDRIGRRTPFMAGMVLAVLSTLGYGLARGASLLLAARLTWGIAWSLIAISGHSMILDLSTDADRGRLVGTYRGLTFLGGSLGMLAGGALSDAVGYHRTFQYLSVATSIGLIAAVVLSETRPGIAADPDRVETSQARVKWLNQWKHAIQGARALDSRLWLAAGLNLIGRFFGSGVIVSTLGRVAEEARRAGVRPPAVIVVGRVVELRDKLWRLS